eukprot:gene30454-37670_t
MPVHGRSVYLHFLDRELGESVDCQASAVEVQRSLHLLALVAGASLNCGTSLLFENPAINSSPSLFRFFNLLLSSEQLDLLSSHPTIPEFLESRAQLYEHDRLRYPMYFEKNPPMPDRVSIVPKTSSATSALVRSLINWGNDGEFKNAREADAKKIVVESLRFREDRAAIGVVRRRISEEYTAHFMNVLRSDIATGMHGLGHFDTMAVQFPYYDLKILNRLIGHFPTGDTIAEVERKAVQEQFASHGIQSPLIFDGGRAFFDLGYVNGRRIALIKSEMGSSSVGGSTTTTMRMIGHLSPKAVVMVGIAFGVDSKKQSLGDVLISKQVLCYDLQRVGTGSDGSLILKSRGEKTSANPTLLSLFQATAGIWSEATVTAGLLLSGEKLVDNIDFREQIAALAQGEAIGGEMEGTGLIAATAETSTPWVIVKAICDWADGMKSHEKEDRQLRAAKNAASFVFRALQQGAEVTLLDRSLPDGKGLLGGFTGFSGAKFSLLPAGQGLVPVAGSLDRLREATDHVLALLDLKSRVEGSVGDTSADEPIAGSGAIRRYRSVVLTPTEIARTIEVISAQVKQSVEVVGTEITRLCTDGRGWVAFGRDGELAQARSVLFAAGRTGGSLLRDAGATTQEGKGVDLGVRIEFLDRRALQSLREQGPDAKILMGRTRTFCLNHPGTIYRYPFRDISIPGGIVGHSSQRRANVGILTRVTSKQSTIDGVRRRLTGLGHAKYEFAPVVRGAPFQDKLQVLRMAYGEAVAGELQAFAKMLGDTNLVDWDRPHKVAPTGRIVLGYMLQAMRLATPEACCRPGFRVGLPRMRCSRMRTSRILDPLYGRTSLDATEVELIRAPEFQRLRNIRMCNINSLLVTGASEISRFEHSLGVLRLAKEWIDSTGASKDQSAVLIAAALLHDVKTGPFGHSLEYTLTDNPRLQDLEHQRLDHNSDTIFYQKTPANVSYLGARFSAQDRLGRLWPLVAQAIAGEGPLGPLISGSIDLDNIDNVVRLAYHMGITCADDSGMAVRLARDLRVQSGRLSVTSSSVPLIQRWQSLRHVLYTYLLHDWAEFSAKGMLTKAIELASEANLIGTDSWILTDDGLLQHLMASSIGDNQEIGYLIKRILLAQLYKPIAILKGGKIDKYKVLSDPQTKREIERQMASVIKSPCLFHVILDKAKTDRKLEIYLRDQNRVAELGFDTQEVLVGLFSSRPLQDSVSARAKSEFEKKMPRLISYGSYDGSGHASAAWGSFAPGLPGVLIDLLSKPGDTVFDPFCGIGTTAVSSLLRGRNSLSCDLNLVGVMSGFATTGLLALLVSEP